MSVLTGRRFEFGIGTGHPGNIRQAVDVIGMPETTAAQRLEQVERSIDRLRELDGDRHTPVLMAVSGRKALAVAAAKASWTPRATWALDTQTLRGGVGRLGGRQGRPSVRRHFPT
jgi:hypothetical protein